ncbi:pilus assembly protein PilM [Paraliomyxa miuraensis]|uniref:pilus assembly protein PilM n=1 Tax=Paraliomyxa miuraensis TaxID=376150 RepID=UPI002259B286|nr:pilus assembly protein PilM [Paraliomyxa miuraensis]MCX4242956.1 pilus assembly protein PilM [Paraliomyxa miuraensis]
MAQKFVGIDLGAHHVKVVVVSAGLRGVQVTDAFSEPVGPAPEDDPEVDPLGVVLATALSVVKQRRLASLPVGICLPPSMCSYRVLSFPFSDERRIAQAVAFEAEGQFPVAVDELFHGHVIVPGAAGGGRALVAAARRDKVEAISDIFKRASVDLRTVTSGAVAMAQIAARPPATPTPPELSERGLEPVSLLVDFGHTSTQLVALSTKGPRAIRVARRGGRHVTAAIAKAYSMGEAEAEAAKHRDAFLPHHGLEQMNDEQLDAGRVVARALEPLLREIGQTRVWLRATYKLEVVRLQIAGGGAALQGLVPYLREQTGLPVDRLQPQALLVKGTEGKDFGTYAVALGAAYGAARRPLLQLHDASSAEAEGSWVQERMSSLIAIGLAVMAFGALDTIAQVKALEAEQAAYEDELAAATLETFGEVLGPSKIEATLAAVDGQDLTSLVPEKGALEVLAMVVEAATPSDLGQAPPPGAGIDPATGQPLPLVDPVTGEPIESGDDDEGDEGGDEPPPVEKKKVEVVDLTRGIVMSDELTLSTVEIRERKIELRVEANSAAAQDRLNYKLKQNSCLTNIQNGKATGDPRKRFDMTMDNGCYYAQPETEETSDSEAADGGENG